MYTRAIVLNISLVSMLPFYALVSKAENWPGYTTGQTITALLLRRSR